MSVVLTLLKGKSRENFITNNQENTIFKFLKILLSSPKKDHVESFVSELKQTILHCPDLTGTVNRWEQQMNSILLNSEIDENRFSKLAEYVHEIKQRELRLNMVRWK